MLPMFHTSFRRHLLPLRLSALMHIDYADYTPPAITTFVHDYAISITLLPLLLISLEIRHYVIDNTAAPS